MRLSHVSHQFDGQLVLNDIELHVSPGNASPSSVRAVAGRVRCYTSSVCC